MFQNEIGIGTRSGYIDFRAFSASAESSDVSDDIKENACPWTETSYRCNDEQKKYRDIDGSCNSLTGKIIYQRVLTTIQLRAKYKGLRDSWTTSFINKFYLPKMFAEYCFHLENIFLKNYVL